MAAAAVAMQRQADQGGPLDSPRRRSISGDLQQMQFSSKTQETIDTLMRNEYYELGIGLIVLFNVFLMVLDVDAALACEEGRPCKIQWVEVVDYILLAIYSADLSCALFAQRWFFFKKGMNYLDATIVIMGYVEVVMTLAFQGGSGLSLIRMLRIARTLRIIKLLKPFPELHKLVMGFMSTLRAIFWGFVMLLLLILLWSIIILQVFSSLDRTNIFQDERFAGYWCEEAMGSTEKTMLLLWQTMITGDSWGACTLPIILRFRGMFWVFAVAFVTISIGFTNLILAVIVDNANSQHEEERMKKQEDHKKKLEKRIEQFKLIFEEMDEDKSQSVSMDELMSGFDDIVELRDGLSNFGIDREDLVDIFQMIDTDDSGDVTYEEFVRAMFKTQRQDTTTQLLMILATVRKLMCMMQRIESKTYQCSRSGGAVNADVAQASNLDKEQVQESDQKSKCPNAELANLSQLIEDSAPRKQTDVLELANLELRLHSATVALHSQSLSLMDETRALTMLLEQVGIARQQPVFSTQSVTASEAEIMRLRTGTKQDLRGPPVMSSANTNKTRLHEDVAGDDELQIRAIYETTDAYIKLTSRQVKGI